MREVVIISGARTPFGLYRGSLAQLRSQDLAASSMREAVTRAGIDSAQVDASIFSESIQSSLPANVGRHGWLLAGLDENPAGYTLNALCGGALQTMISAFSKILAGEYEAILTGGVETNSQAPYYIEHPRYELGSHNLYFHDQRREIESNAQPRERYGILSRYDIADTIARHYGLSRGKLDEYAWNSKFRAIKAIKNGAMSSCITALSTKINKREVVVDQDQGPVASSMEELLAMPAIKEDGTATQGNTATPADGAASIIMAAANKAKEWQIRPLASLSGFAITAGNPVLIEKTSLKSIGRALQFAGMTLKDIDFIDIHEPSAAFALAVSEQLGSDAVGKINVDGGSLAYGHAGAATGGAMVVNMLYRLEQRDAAVGLINVGALGGQSFTIIIKR